MTKTALIKIRAKPDQKKLLTRAARLMKVDRTTFILNAACREARSVLLEQRFFQLDADAFSAFEAALVARPTNPADLKTLCAESPPWEE